MKVWSFIHWISLTSHWPSTIRTAEYNHGLLAERYNVVIAHIDCHASYTLLIEYLDFKYSINLGTKSTYSDLSVSVTIPVGNWGIAI